MVVQNINLFRALIFVCLDSKFAIYKEYYANKYQDSDLHVSQHLLQQNLTEKIYLNPSIFVIIDDLKQVDFNTRSYQNL